MGSAEPTTSAAPETEAAEVGSTEPGGLPWGDVETRDKAALRASGKRLSPHLPPRGKVGQRAQTPTMEWQARAACAGVSDDLRQQFTEARFGSEAAPVAAYCATCLVAVECLAFGRRERGWGVYAGHVLLDGFLGADEPPKRQ